MKATPALSRPSRDQTDLSARCGRKSCHVRTRGDSPCISPDEEQGGRPPCKSPQPTLGAVPRQSRHGGSLTRLDRGPGRTFPTRIGLALALAFGALPPALALPTGEQVVSGQVSVGRPTAQNMVVQQGTGSAIVHWNSFSIGAAEGVQFLQPGASSTILNRVVQSNPSQIAGRLTANGRVFLVNPSGVLFTRGASVDVGALVASPWASAMRISWPGDTALPERDRVRW